VLLDRLIVTSAVFREWTFSITSHYANLEIALAPSAKPPNSPTNLLGQALGHSPWFPLDFIAKASIALSMDEISKERARKVFAEVTGRLEDASILALVGQSQEIEAQTVALLKSQLTAELSSINNLLRSIELIGPPEN